MGTFKKIGNFLNHIPSLLKLIALFTLVFLAAIAIDLSPFLRGPAPYFPDWRWSYEYVPTWHKIWAPFVVFCAIAFTAYKAEERGKTSSKKAVRFLVLIVFLGMLFNLSITYFSRAGLNSVVQRVIDGGNNGYFTTSTEIQSVQSFLSDYDTNVLSFHQHAEGHPPGAILLHYTLTGISSVLPSPVHQLLPSPKTEPIGRIWGSLLPFERTSAVISIGVIILLSNLTAALVYAIGKNLYSERIGIRAAILTILIPAISFFYPLPDSYYPLFGVAAFWLLLLGIKRYSSRYIFGAGTVFALGLFFSFSLLPLLFFYFVYIGISLFDKTVSKLHIAQLLTTFVSAIVFFYIALYIFFHYNVIAVFTTVMSGLPESRSYLTWLLYNPYDFFVFSGIPLSLLFLTALYALTQKRKRKIGEVLAKNRALISFAAMLVVLILSGSVRGEVGRIWLPLMPFVALFAHFLSVIKSGRFQNFLLIAILLALQTVLMQEFWVMLW